LGKQSLSGNIRFTVGQYWLIIKINGTNSVNFVGNSVNIVGNMLCKGLIPRALFLGEMRNISPVSFEL
jgi:hypothetical protein